MTDKAKKKTRIEFTRGVIFEDLFWNPGGVVDMDSTHAEYLVETEIAKYAPNADLTSRPTPLTVPEKETATSVANAIANAITAAQPKPAEEKASEAKK